jgi:hypothetical protein
LTLFEEIRSDNFFDRAAKSAEQLIKLGLRQGLTRKQLELNAKLLLGVNQCFVGVNFNSEHVRHLPIFDFQCFALGGKFQVHLVTFLELFLKDCPLGGLFLCARSHFFCMHEFYG